MTTPAPEPEAFSRLIEVIAQLRKRCPWMGALTHASLVEYLLEESYELIDTIESGGAAGTDVAGLRDELGDVLLQVLVHTRIQEELGHFTLDDVARTLCAKMIRRNPHVFTSDGELRDLADSKAKSTEDIEQAWQHAKRLEKPARSDPFEGIPRRFPALALAAKVLKRVDRNSEPQLDTDLDAGPTSERKLGDELLLMVRRANTRGLDSERALRNAVDRMRQP